MQIPHLGFLAYAKLVRVLLGMQNANLKLLRTPNFQHYCDTQNVAFSLSAGMKKKAGGFVLSYLKTGLLH